MSGDRDPPSGSWSASAIRWSGSVYGTILTSSIVVALSYKERGTALVMIAALVVTEVVISVAHGWSTALAEGQARARFPKPSDLEHAARHEWPVLQASWPAIAILALAAVGLIRTETAVYIALVANAAILFVGGVALAHVAGARMPVMLAAGAVTCALGVALVALKVAVH